MLHIQQNKVRLIRMHPSALFSLFSKHVCSDSIESTLDHSCQAWRHTTTASVTWSPGSECEQQPPSSHLSQGRLGKVASHSQLSWQGGRNAGEITWVLLTAGSLGVCGWPDAKIYRLHAFGPVCSTWHRWVHGSWRSSQVRGWVRVGVRVHSCLCVYMWRSFANVCE